MGHLTMSSKEAPRPGLLKAVTKGKLTNREVAQALNLSVRQVRRLRRRWEGEGVSGMTHRLRGRPSNRGLAARLLNRITKLMTTTYAGLNDCHLTEKLREQEKLDVSRSTLRRLRLAQGREAKRPRKPPRYFRRRLREARVGQRVLLDASEFAWLGDTSGRFTAFAAQDDATGSILALTFRPHEDLHGYATLLRQLFTAHGLPLELYGDRFGAFVRNDSHWTLEEQLAGRQRPTQLGQLFDALGVTFIAAQSPQAKGRIERLWGTLQDRLTQELRLAHITTVEGAQAFVPAFCADLARRFAVPPRESRPAWRPAPRDLDRLIGCRYWRVVARDYTLSLPGRLIQLPPGCITHGARVELRELLDGRLLVFHQDRCIAEQPPPPGAFVLVPRDSLRRRKPESLGIDLHRSPRIDDRLARRVRPHTPKQTRINPERPRPTPPPTHPWRKSYDPLTSPLTR